MEVTLKFTLPEEQPEYEMHANAGKLYSAVWDYAEWLRGICKHGNPGDFNAEACREKLYEFLKDNDYNL
jgi:hypothetical protein